MYTYYKWGCVRMCYTTIFNINLNINSKMLGRVAVAQGIG